MNGPGPGDKSGDLYDSGMGPLGPDGVTGGSVEFDQTDQKDRIHDHHNVHGPGAHFSWNTDPQGNSYEEHGTLHGPNRPW
jgi:hypothetical protein